MDSLSQFCVDGIEVGSPSHSSSRSPRAEDCSVISTYSRRVFSSMGILVCLLIVLACSLAQWTTAAVAGVASDSSEPVTASVDSVDFSKNSENSQDEEAKLYLKLGEQFTGKGADYRGLQTITRSGYACQPWAWQKPHTHPYSPSRKKIQKERSGRLLLPQP